jgi:methionyl aminopeptidase
MLGHLQTNKVKQAIYIFELIQSVDSLRLAQQIDKEAKKINANVVTDLGGHGLELNCLHGSPFVPNNGEKGKGPIVFPGTTIAIEPILTFGNPGIKLMNDGWTVVLNDVGVHWEHTIFVHEDRIEIITGE